MVEAAKEKLGQAKECVSEKVSDTVEALKETARSGMEKAEHLGKVIKEKTVG